MRNSPLARTPPKNLPNIPGMMTSSKMLSNASGFIDPGITSGLGKAEETSPTDSGKKKPASSAAAKTDDDQFSMDI